MSFIEEAFTEEHILESVLPEETLESAEEVDAENESSHEFSFFQDWLTSMLVTTAHPNAQVTELAL